MPEWYQQRLREMQQRLDAAGESRARALATLSLAREALRQGKEARLRMGAQIGSLLAKEKWR